MHWLAYKYFLLLWITINLCLEVTEICSQISIHFYSDKIMPETFDFSFRMFELPEMTKRSLLCCDSLVIYSQRDAYRWHSQVVDTLGSIYKVQNTLPFIQHGGRIPARSCEESAVTRAIVQLVLHVTPSDRHISVYSLRFLSIMFIIYTNKSRPRQGSWESEFLTCMTGLSDHSLIFCGPKFLV